MEYRDILSFLDYLRLLSNDNEYKRRALINIFINAIYLYDRYFTLILNTGNRPISIENIPLDNIEETFANDYEGGRLTRFWLWMLHQIEPTSAKYKYYKLYINYEPHKILRC